MGLAERQVVAYFQQRLEADGWHVDLEVGWVDVVATRAGRTLIAEAKGSTSAPGLDVDTAYGQLLRRMHTDPATTYAIVVPREAAGAALRVPSHVLEALHVSVYSVTDEGEVRLESGHPA